MPQHKPHFSYLKEKWTNRHSKLQKSLWDKHKESLAPFINSTKQVALGSVGGLLLLTAPQIPSLPAPQLLVASQQAQHFDRKTFLISDLFAILPDKVRPLTLDEEEKIVQILSRDFHISIASEVDGKRLDRSYGVIGVEQHLTRFPGDTINTHFDSEEGAKNFSSEGMAPGLGAWGYFATSKETLTVEDIFREKYYIAVQTFLAPGFNERFAEYRDFFKYRKMLVVNPNNGKAIIADIADSGPSIWTGKHLGGSPEVMQYLERVDGEKKRGVLFYFVHDPQNTVPLGPIGIQ